MSTKIVNIAKKQDDENINALRDAFSHRAMWLYYLLNEAKKAGADWADIGYKATFSCGCVQGEAFKQLIDGTDLKAFKTEFAEPNGNGRKIFEMECIKDTDDAYYLDFYYCPLIDGWKKAGCDDDEIATLCDIAMNGDRGIASVYPDFQFTLGKTIAQGHHCCEIRFDNR